MTTGRGGFRNILVATDLSAASLPAFERAVELARSGRGRLVITHVLVPPEPLATDTMVFPRVYEELEAQMRSEAQGNLRRLLARARKARVRATALLVRGTADREICRSAVAQKADLLVLGTHGRTGLARVFLGSVAARVLASAPCPVLVVPPRRALRRARARA